MNARDWIATRREIEQAATDGPWMSEWDTSDEWWTIHGQPNPTKGDDRMVCPEVATLQHSEDWTADVDFITDTRTSLPLALDALDAVLREIEKRKVTTCGRLTLADVLPKIIEEALSS